MKGTFRNDMDFFRNGKITISLRMEKAIFTWRLDPPPSPIMRPSPPSHWPRRSAALSSLPPRPRRPRPAPPRRRGRRRSRSGCPSRRNRGRCGHPRPGGTGRSLMKVIGYRLQLVKLILLFSVLINLTLSQSESFSKFCVGLVNLY